MKKQREDQVGLLEASSIGVFFYLHGIFRHGSKDEGAEFMQNPLH